MHSHDRSSRSSRSNSLDDIGADTIASSLDSHARSLLAAAEIDAICDDECYDED